MASAELSALLLTYLVHSTLFLGAAWIISPRLKSHRIRETLWKTALFGGFFTAAGQSLFQVSPLAGRMTVMSPVSRATTDKPARSVPRPLVGIGEKPDQAGDTPNPGALLENSTAPVTAGLERRDLLNLSWLVGAGFLLALYLVRRVRFGRRIAGRRGLSAPPLVPMLDELRNLAGISRPIRLTVSAALPSPVALGGSEIAVPDAALTELDPGQQRSMLAHELAHLARRDPSWLTAACVAESIGFIQPLNVLARKRIQESAEYLCDEWAVSRTGSGVLLAKCLAKVAEWLETAPRSVPVSGMAEERSHLVARVRRLLDGAPFPTAPRRRILVTASFGVLAVTLLALPAVSLTRHQPPAPSADAAVVSLVTPTAQDPDTNRAIVLALIGVLKDPNVEVRRAAVKSIANFEDRTAAAALRESLHDSDAEVRASAVEALGDMHDAASADAIAALIKDPNRDVRSHAIEALTDLEIAAAPAGLLDALKDSDAEVRHQAAHAVAHFEDTRAVPQLRLMLEDPDGDVREAAVEALGDIRNEAAIQALIGALKAKDPKVRQGAADALGKRGDGDK